jgi:4-amino-4-deoxy-L-arabinose transferase-like glycosyltransferase
MKECLFGPLDQRSKVSLFVTFTTVVASLGFILRIVLLCVAGNRVLSPFSGVGDQIRYLTLADSIFQGRGFSYAGQPTALRPPLYPFVLAGSHIVFGAYYLLAVRALQFVAGLGIAYLCFRLARKHFGIEAGTMAGAIALALPTLIFITAELQTEDFAALLTILFLFHLMDEPGERKSGAAIMGVTSGLATLLRFNCAILPVIGAIVCFWFRKSLKRPAVIGSIAALMVAPWIIRNAVVFHGQVLFSSHGGVNLLEGVLTPDGRAQKGEGEQIRAAVGWEHTDIERNDAHRLLFPGEVQLDRQAREAGLAAWQSLDWNARARLLSKKLLTFWLSTDQLLETRDFSIGQRRLRAAGVIAYYGVLFLALAGWVHLLRASKERAWIAGFYTLFVTAAHFPFVMNTRLRIPFMDPLVAVLAGGGLYALAGLCLGIRPAPAIPEPQNQ